uniref:Uncharacterized protein n=1 Tax=Cacopsylla melanoneura TaxID=428564 RepID=A0A8D8YPG2_9HEMI
MNFSQIACVMTIKVRSFGVSFSLKKRRVLEFNFKIPTRMTRRKQLFHRTKSRTNTGENARLWRCQKLWNEASDGGVDVFSDPPNKVVETIVEIMRGADEQ